MMMDRLRRFWKWFSEAIQMAIEQEEKPRWTLVK